VAAPAATPSATPAPRSFNFWGSVADEYIKKEKPDPAPAADAVADSSKAAPDETEAQRAKRLRKEARAGLRVTWADNAGKELLHVKTFSHDPDEELHDVNLARDVGDVNEEARMFKQQRHRDQGEDGGDEEGGEESFGAGWRGLAEYDLDDDALLKNFARFGGPIVPDTPAAREEDEHEANTLTALYFDRDDVPRTPKSPVHQEEPYVPPRSLGPAPESTLARLRQRPAAAAQTAAAPVMGVSALLGGLVSQASSGAPDVSALLSGLVQQARSAGGGPDIDMGDADYDPPPAAAATAVIADVPVTVGDLTALLSLLANQNGAAAAGGGVLAQQMGVQQDAYSAAAMPAPQQAYAPPPPPPQHGYGAPQQVQHESHQPERKRVREADPGDNDAEAAQGGAPAYKRARGGARGGYKKGSDRGGANGGGRGRPPPSAGGGGGGGPEGKKFSEACRFWPEGRCRKGADCTYRHD
jgi:hypothetical protein